MFFRFLLVWGSQETDLFLSDGLQNNVCCCQARHRRAQVGGLPSSFSTAFTDEHGGVIRQLLSMAVPHATSDTGLQAHVVVHTYNSSTWMLRQVDCEISLDKTSLNSILRLYLKQEEGEGKEEKEAETTKEPICEFKFQNVSLENHPSLSYSQKLKI